eukprot:3918771-Prymnesium_polylepis.1
MVVEGRRVPQRNWPVSVLRCVDETGKFRPDIVLTRNNCFCSRIKRRLSVDKHPAHGAVQWHKMCPLPVARQLAVRT